MSWTDLTGTYQQFGIANGATGSQDLDVPTGTDLMVVSVVGYRSSATYPYSGGTVTIDGNTMTAVPSDADATGDDFQSAMFYLASPPIGSTLAWEWSWLGGNSDPPVIVPSYWSGVNTSDPYRDSDGVQGDTATGLSTATLTAISGDLILSFCGAYVNSGEGSLSWTNATEKYAITTVTNTDGSLAYALPTGNTSISETGSNTTDGSLTGVVFKAAAAAAEKQTSYYRRMRTVARR